MIISFTVRGDEISQMWQVYGGHSPRSRTMLIREFPYGDYPQDSYEAAKRFGYYWSTEYSIEQDAYTLNPVFVQNNA